MDDSQLEEPKPRHARNLDEEPAPETPARRTRRHLQVILPLRHMAVLIGINAVVSLTISLLVVALVGRGADIPGARPATPEPAASAVRASPLPVDTPAPAGQTAPPVPPTGATPAVAAALPTATQPSNAPAATLTIPSGPTDTPTAPPPIATPTATPALGEPIAYLVQPGDTLSTIAQRFNVSLDDLMRANAITNPDYLLLGQKLVIPVGGLPIVTLTFTPGPPPSATPLPVEPPTPLPPGNTPGPVPAASLAPVPTPIPTLTPVPASDIQLTLEILNPGDPVKEVAYIVNHGLYVRLTGWILSDGRGDVYTFPDFGLGGGGAGIGVHTGSGVNTPADLYWGRPATVWKKGDVAALKDSSGTVVAAFNVK